MSFKDTLSNIEINREGHISPKNIITIDGKEIKGIRNVKVVYGVDSIAPIITLEFYAKIKAKVKKAKVVKILKAPSKDVPWVLHKDKSKKAKKAEKKKKKNISEVPYVLHGVK